jgi:hypothetical protein
VSRPDPPEASVTDHAGDASVGHVVARLAVLELRVRAAIARRRAEEPAHSEPAFRGLYLAEEDVDHLLAANPLRRDDAADAVELLRQVEAAADLAEARGEELRLRQLARAFALEPLDVDVLLVACAPDVDARFELLYAYLHDDVSRRRPSVGLALELAGASSFSAAERARCGPGAVLAASDLIVVDEPGRPLLSRELRVPDRVVQHLLGADTPDASLATVAPTPVTGETGLSVREALDSGARLVYLRDPSGAAEAATVAHALRELGTDACAVDLDRVAQQSDPSMVLRSAAREARLTGRVLVAGPVDVLVEHDLAALRIAAEAPCPVMLVGRASWEPKWSTAIPHAVSLAPPTRAAAVAAWRAQLDAGERRSVGARTLGDLADRYRLGAGQIGRAVVAARAAAQARGEHLGVRHLRAGARAQNAAGLERFAVRIEPAVSWRDLVLPRATADELHHVAARARHQHLVMGEWGVRLPGRRRRGCIALFAGESGTGKTMAAEVLAGDLGLDLYLVNLATVVDKYIGETEKNLERILTEAQGVNGVLLFDEADALLGKRSEVKDARDRYANIEVAHLLQLLDAFEGILLLTTNLRANLDAAFTRRLDALVDFPSPEPAERLRLWQRAFGDAVPLGADVDLDFCATSFRLTGGSIRAIALTAAFLAAEARGPVSMRDVMRATRREYRKLGRICTAAEFGPYVHDESLREELDGGTGAPAPRVATNGGAARTARSDARSPR